MTDNKKIPETGADLLQLLDDSDDLTKGRRRDLKSAIKRICEMVRVAPAALPADPVALRGILRKIRPAAHGVSPKTWSNLRSLLGATLQLAGVADPMGSGLALQSPDWKHLLVPIRENKRLSHGLAAFANWCAVEGILSQRSRRRDRAEILCLDRDEDALSKAARRDPSRTHALERGEWGHRGLAQAATHRHLLPRPAAASLLGGARRELPC